MFSHVWCDRDRFIHPKFMRPQVFDVAPNCRDKLVTRDDRIRPLNGAPQISRPHTQSLWTFLAQPFRLDFTNSQIVLLVHYGSKRTKHSLLIAKSLNERLRLSRYDDN